MESWSYVSGGKGAMANDSIAPADSSSVSNNSLMGWELHTPCSFGSNLLVSNREDIGDQSFKKFGIQELVEKRVPNNSVNDVLCSKNHAIYPFMSNSSISFGGDESTSKISISAVESNGCWTSSLIDLNLGRFADHRDAHSSKFSHATTRLSSSASSTPPRRLRLGGVSSLTACCQVYGCNKDLSSSKDYHKRHRVCETHSKATKVIVNGVEQRFCQQCSRFHSLNEFDDSKRSCRKHLKGHNERRRKPQIDILSGRTAKLLRSHAAFAGCKYQGTKLPMSSSICQDVFGMGIFRPEKCVANDCCKRLKLEDRTDCNPLSATLSANRNLHSRSISTHYDFRKAAPSFHGTEGNTATESIFSVTRATHPHDLGGPNSCSSPLFQGSSLASDDFNGFYTDSAAQGSPAMSESGRALSLLSSKSHESSSPLSGIPVARPLVITGSNTTHYNINQVCEKLIGVSSQASNKSSSTGNYNPIGGNNLGSILMSQSSCNAANFDDSHGFYQGLDFMNSKDHLSCENGATIDLLHLSSQLQRVEHQRQSMQVKDDSDSFCCLRIT